MAYIKNVWVDQDVERPKTYEIIENDDDSVTLIESFGVVTEIGTPVNATNMNHIEDGIDNHETRITVLESRKVVDDHALKSYLDSGELLTDAEGLADVKNYAHSTYDGTKFTKVGNPTITDNGVITYFPAQSGLYSESFTPFSAGSNWVVEGSFKGSDGTKSYPTFTIRNNSVNAEVISVTAIGSTNASHPSALLIYYPTDASTRPFVYTSNNMWQANTQYYYKVLYDGSLKVYFGADKNNLTLVKTVSTIFTNYNFDRIMFNGMDINSWQPERVGISLDLKNFSVSINGATVFNGNQTGIDTYTIGGSTVTIPYTLSKTGSKIVDSAYRTEVTSLYNQQGYTPYYTLSNTDFTLPMGELYGFIQNATDGEFIYVDQTNSANVISTATAIGTYDITSAVKALLPSDTDIYTYECLFYYNMSRSSGNDSSFYSALISSNVVMYDAIDGSASTTVYGGQYKAVLKSGDTISLSITNHALTSHSTYLVGYRRLAK